MQIKIPRALAKLLALADDWANVTLYEHERFDLRRIDLVLAAGFLFCIGWYGYAYGWQGAAQGGVMYVLMGLTALMLRR